MQVLQHAKTSVKKSTLTTVFLIEFNNHCLVVAALNRTDWICGETKTPYLRGVSDCFSELLKGETDHLNTSWISAQKIICEAQECNTVSAFQE